MLRNTTVKNGEIQGLPGTDPRITVYKGIPYALPPVGENRFRAPQPAKNWDGVFKAFEFAPISYQDQPGVGDDITSREWFVDPDVPMSEDSLYLNIWTPAKRAGEKLPVLVWIHGGAFQWGYSSEMEFDGEQLASRGIVVVSLNYRLAVFGFLSHPEITADSPDAPSNFGLLDQRLAINWVHDNIAAFGGDPDMITIAGQSAGGGSVLNQLACTGDNSFIKRAAIFSGVIELPDKDADIFSPLSLSEAEKKGEAFFKIAGIAGLEEAKKLSAKDLLSKYNEYVTSENGDNLLGIGRCFPVKDDKFVTGNPTQALKEGKSLNVPILLGNTSDEFIIGGVNAVEHSIKNVIAGAQKQGSKQDFYYYRFDPDIPSDGDKKEPYPGTFHSCDLWFFFNSITKCRRFYKGRHYDLAKQMCDYFANFVKTGNPNGKGCDNELLPTWEPYTLENKAEMEFLGCGATPCIEGGIRQNSRKQAVNPYLPSWEYIPDGEPYVFGDRIYIYGSHDLYGGETFCLGDYVCWSAPVNDLGNWKYEGVIYEKTSDPLNKDGHMCLYAPDVTVGPDGRYYLYYVLDKVSVVSVAVSDTPAGHYEFYGYVHYEDGTKLGDKETDEPQFDPGVMTEGDLTYLFTGFCGQGDRSRHGAMLTVLGRDMLTIIKPPVFVAPGNCYSEGTPYEGHAFFEAPSIRKIKDTYYFIYSSEVMHELCYATSKSPEGPFSYGGVIVSNCDMHIGTYKEAELPSAYGANNHGSIEKIGDDWYIFYHRHTNGTWYSRQGCAEKLTVKEDGSIPQVEITSCGLNGGPLSDIGEYPAYLACNIFTDEHKMYVEASCPRVIQEGGDDYCAPGHIKAIVDTTTIGFKYFDLKDVTGLRIKTRGYFKGDFEVRTSLTGDPLGKIPVDFTNIWASGECRFAGKLSGTHALYLVFKGTGEGSLKSIEFLH
ncbi:carboxylesterase family protein [Butyrivibrio sp. INlla21]|uniref:carboxylesterase family protein n=1 Tax=Butyrivibrio sp. INlla21 TaxID=1520811 RepID=UPI0008DFC85E|nr:carboxylesterase family protein [Butyrivibrio sp. INlla21]SFU93139.1 Carboxylesterase type B [Butyrivibrio sp. INlla21]